MKASSNQAQVAKLIKAELKRLGVIGSVKSKSYAGGNSVRVKVLDQPPGVVKAIETFCNQFEYGSFNGMIDLYEYTNRRNDIPQVKFIFVNVDISDGMKQKVYDYCRSYFVGCENLPEKYEDGMGQLIKNQNSYVDALVRQVFCGSNGKFWEPEVRATCSSEVVDFIDPTGALRKAGLLSIAISS